MCKITFVPCRISFCLNWAQQFSVEPCANPNDCNPTFHPTDADTGFEYCARCQKALQATAPRPYYRTKARAAKPRRGFSPSSTLDIATGREREYLYPPTAAESAYDALVRTADRASRLDDEEPYRLMLGLESPLPFPPLTPQPTAEPKKTSEPHRSVSMRPPSPWPGKIEKRPEHERAAATEGFASETGEALGGGVRLRGGQSMDSLLGLYLRDESDGEGEGEGKGEGHDDEDEDEDEVDSLLEMYVHL